MNHRRIDIASIRKEQIVEAAVAIIAEQGLQHLSLSEIEQRAGMSRGQLTYYFPTKEAILLAVFDRLLQLLCQHSGTAEGRPGPPGKGAVAWVELWRQALKRLLQRPPAHPEFHALQYTFLSQIGHREDFRRRLANLYEEWRVHFVEYVEGDLARRPPARPVSLRALATVVQAIMHGLAVQNNADPQAIDRAEVVDLCLDMMSTYLWGRARPSAVEQRPIKAGATRKRPVAARASGKEVNGERSNRT
jgi:AcrR family transcriptional regulator